MGVDEAIAEGAPRFSEELGVWTQPGVFSWDRLDPGSALLLQHLPGFTGRGADLGCGLGYLTRHVLTSPHIINVTMIDIDRRAIELAAKNVEVETARKEAERIAVLNSNAGAINYMNAQAQMKIAEGIAAGKVNTIVVPYDFKGMVQVSK